MILFVVAETSTSVGNRQRVSETPSERERQACAILAAKKSWWEGVSMVFYVFKSSLKLVSVLELLL